MVFDQFEKKVFQHKFKYKYRMSTYDKILENIDYMIRHNITNEQYSLGNYEPTFTRYVNKYRNVISLLKAHIEEYNQSKTNLANEVNRLNQIKQIYESVIVQESCTDLATKSKLMKYYEQNCKKLESKRGALENIISVQREMKESKEILFKIEQNFKEEIKLDTSKDLPFNLNKIWTFMINKQFQQMSSQASQDQIESTQHILLRMISKIERDQPLDNCRWIIQKIKTQRIRVPLSNLVETLDNHLQKLSKEVEDMKNIYHMQNDEGSLVENLQLIKKRTSQQEQFTNYLINQQTQNMLILKIFPIMIVRMYQFAYSRSTSISSLDQKQMNRLIEQLDVKIKEFEQLKLRAEDCNKLQSIICHFLKQSNNPINSQVTSEKIKTKLQAILSDKDEREPLSRQQPQMITEQLQQKERAIVELRNLNELLKEKLSSKQLLHSSYRIIEQKNAQTKERDVDKYVSRSKFCKNQQQSQIKQKQSKTTYLNNLYLPLLKELKTQIQDLKNQKNDLITQLQDIRHHLEDQKITIACDFQKKIRQEIEKVKKQVNIEKAKEVQKIEEKRRAQKKKLCNQYQQIFEELEELKVKYYMEIEAKMSRSRLDITMSRVNDIAIGNSILDDNNFDSQDIGIETSRLEIFLQEEVQQLQQGFKKQLEIERQRLTRLTLENRELTMQLDVKNKQNQDMTFKIRVEEQKMEQWRTNISVFSQNLNDKDTEISQLRGKLNILLQTKKQYEVALKKFSSEKNSTNSTLSIECTPLLIPYRKVLFQNQIFENDDQGKQILLKHIADYMNRTLVKTQLLYKYDPNNKSNFHLYIDNKINLACVIRTKNAVIAGFYPDQLKDSGILNTGGLLVSVTNNQSYRLLVKKNDNSKVNFRGMTYDPYYAIFGNAEMRVRTGEKKVFCNFGIQNSYFDYDGKNRRIEAFLNEENREVEFQYCEFYQLTFENPTYPMFQNPEGIFRTY